MTPEPILVSIVIPCFNQARFLVDAILSAKRQTYPNAEVIVVDDGSTDNTPEIAEHLGVTLLKQENRGLAGARNAGLKASRGTFIVFLDADDLLLPHALEAGVDAFAKSPECAFVFGHYRRISEGGSVIDSPPSNCQQPDAYLGFLRTNFVVMHGAVMFRKDILDAIGGYDESLRLCEDYDLYLRVTRDHRAACHHELVADYRRHGMGLSDNTRGMLAGMVSVLRSHRPSNGAPQGAIEAWREGMRHWRSLYGGELAKQLKTKARKRASVRELAGDALALLRYNPQGIAGAVGRRLRGPAKPPAPGSVDFGDFRRLTPVSAWFGFERGTPVDRHYIERFLDDSREGIRGRVLEVGDSNYTKRFGGAKVTSIDVLHVSAGAAEATIVADLAGAPHIESDSFDCVILTQTLQLIFDVPAAIATIYRILKPGGIALVTIPGITQTDKSEWRESWYWSFTQVSARKLFAAQFPNHAIAIQQHGNVLAATAFLQGVAADELAPAELDHRDDQYPVVIAIRAVKPLSRE